MDSDPMVMKRDSRMDLYRRHVARDAIFEGRLRADFFPLINIRVALPALFCVVFSNSIDGLMWIVTRCAAQPVC